MYIDSEMVLLLLVIMIISPRLLISKSINLQYISNKRNNDIKIKALLGTPSKEYIFKLDLSSHNTVLPLNDHLISSSSFNDLNLEITDGVFKGKLSNDLLKLEQKDQENVYFTLPFLMYTPFVPNINVTYLGLGVGKHSILTTLFDMKFINKRIFQIERENIIIGSFNNTIRTQSLESCNLTYTDIGKYSCLLHKIDLSYPSFSKTETVMAKAIFKLDYDNMSIPHSYWFFFKKYYLKDHLLQNKCKYLESMYAITVKCLSDVKMLLPDVKLTFDNAELVLTPDDLFNSDVVDSDKRILFRIDFVTDITHWALGIFFIKKFRMIFNTEDGILQFVTEIEMNNNETHANKEMIRRNTTIIGFILICILTFGISFNVNVLNKSKIINSNKAIISTFKYRFI